VKGSTLVAAAMAIAAMGAVIAFFQGPELTPAEQQARHLTELSEQAAETERKAKEAEGEALAEYRDGVRVERELLVSWCEDATGNRIYAQNYTEAISVSQNDDSCPQPNPQLVGVERP
jgi:hypothetical protein